MRFLHTTPGDTYYYLQNGMLNLEHKSLAEVWAHALDQYPNECCGVLLGTRVGDLRSVQRIARCRNIHSSPATRYEIDPAELISIQRQARELQLEIVGFYHSHPNHPPSYSSADLEQAHWEGCSYLIVSVEDRQVTSARSFVLHEDGQQSCFIEEPLIEAVHL